MEVEQGLEGVDAGKRFLELLEIGVSRRPVADDPVDLVPVLVEDENGRRRLDSEPGEDGFPGEVAARRTIENERLGEEIGELGVFVNLLDQQVAASSATSLVEVDEDGFVLLLGQGQRLVEGALKEGRALGGSHRGHEDESGKNAQFFHGALHSCRALWGTIY
jgi:hypothetical protein